ncbi:SGNH/GDSL hydrolase family protein [Microcella sp.]|uniref:SGNH/GDSL hydrolase family protein n=1 Tax=Microcella sp. TaxID=1913979 RepID=UPI0039197902
MSDPHDQHDRPTFSRDGLAVSRAVALALAPVIVPQSRELRERIPILPEAPGPWRGATGDKSDAHPVRMLVLGDSTAAGVGVDDAAAGLGGQLARALTEATDRRVLWRASGRSGATARDLIGRYLRPALREQTTLVFLSVGANDALAVRSARGFRRDVAHIVDRVFDAHPDAVLLMSSLPAFFRFRGLPEPLRSTLYRHSQALEHEARDLIDAHPRAHMSPPPPPYTEGFFAVDEFHPGAQGYREWADFAVADALASPVADLLDD